MGTSEKEKEIAARIANGGAEGGGGCTLGCGTVSCEKTLDCTKLTKMTEGLMASEPSEKEKEIAARIAESTEYQCDGLKCDGVSCSDLQCAGMKPKVME
jgi:hypothetical protein